MDDSYSILAEPLYANFLDNKGTYQLARNYWKEQFEAVFVAFDHPYASYEEAQRYDGDPIFTAYFPTMSRSVRIVQHAPEDGRLRIGARLEQVSLDQPSRQVDELRIDLVLSKRSANLTRQLLRQWIIAYLPLEAMEEEIGKRLDI